MATTYGITHVRYNTDGAHINQVRVSTVIDSQFSGSPQILTRAQVVAALGQGHSYYTLLNNGGAWQWGAKVETVRVNGTTYIRTDSNSTARDNLGSLPTF